MCPFHNSGTLSSLGLVYSLVFGSGRLWYFEGSWHPTRLVWLSRQASNTSLCTNIKPWSGIYSLVFGSGMVLNEGSCITPSWYDSRQTSNTSLVPISSLGQVT
jgi:hypothetical protein